MNGFIIGPWSRTIFVWACVILAGSLYAYFYPGSQENIFMTWGALLLVGIAISVYFAGRSASSYIIHIFWGVLIISTFGMQILTFFKGFPRELVNYDLYLEWSVICSVGYIVTALITRSRQFLIGGIATFFLILLFNVPGLARYTPLLFGIPHGAFLLIIAFS